jgi:hypothetical protein
MLQLFPSCSLSGEQFSPKRAAEESGVLLQDASEVGELGTLGRYRGLPQPYGMAFVRAPAEIPAAERLSWIVAAVSRHLPTFRRHGADEVVLDLSVGYKHQCNLVFSPDELRCIADLGIPFTISCVWDDDLPD